MKYSHSLRQSWMTVSVACFSENHYLASSTSGQVDTVAAWFVRSLEHGGVPIGHGKGTHIAQVAAVIVRENENNWLRL
jgi:hypothetical protein